MWWFYDLLTDMMWRAEVPTLEPWVMEYIHRRYGRELPKMQEAWKLLLETAYGPGAPIASTSLFDRLLKRKKQRRQGKGTPEDQRKVARACQAMLACADELGDVDTYRFDLVHVTREALANLTRQCHAKMVRGVQGGRSREDCCGRQKGCLA